MASFKTVRCATCGAEVEKEAKYVQQAQRRGQTRFFCTRSCSGTKSNTERTASETVRTLIRSRSSNRRDEFTPFRFHLKVITQRCKDRGLACTLTLESLKAQWERQGGCCPYTGWLLQHSELAQRGKLNPKTPRRASVDRIDPSRGYEPDNIEFVAMIANYAKNEWSHKDLIDFCRAVAQQHPLDP